MGIMTAVRGVARSVLPAHTRYLTRRWLENIGPALSFSFNAAQRQQATTELAECRTVPDYMAFTQRYLGGGSVQQIEEIEPAMAYIAAASPQRVCEIGTDFGGTNFLMGHVWPNIKLVIGVDLFVKNAAQLRYFKRNNQQIHLLNGSSYSDQMVKQVESILNGQKLDVLFIDGDHSYNGVKQDFVQYRHLINENGFVLFHDIVPDFKARFGQETKAYSGEVPKFWNEIRQFYPHKEFVRDPMQNGLGIGVLRYSSSVKLPDD